MSSSPSRVAHCLLTGVSAVAALFLVTACGSGSSGGDASTWPRCYSLTESTSVATIRLEPRESADDPEAGQITIYSFLDGQEEFPPETTAGRLTLSTFVFADGTALAFNDRELTWPQDSLLEGSVFVAAPCP